MGETRGPFRQRLLDEMAAGPVVDCHSHTMLRREYEARGERSLFTIGSYFERDLSALAGRPAAELYAGAADDAERWRRLRGCWPGGATSPTGATTWSPTRGCSTWRGTT